MIYLLGMILIALAGIGYICYYYLSKLLKLYIAERLEQVEQDGEIKESAFLGDTVLHTNQQILAELLRQGQTRPG